MKILFIGDVVGRPGRNILKEILKKIKKERNIDIIICNAENSAGGFGINGKVAQELFSSGVDYITLGNHVWDKKEAYELLNNDYRIIRPINYPEGAPGIGWNIFKVKDGLKLGIINASGRIFLDPLDCPFAAVDNAVQEISKETNLIVVDFHAEATSEKLAFGWYFSKTVSAVLGTHTHVQTADESILHNHTAYISDVGMTGPINSILGMKKEGVINKFLSGLPERFEVANNPGELNAVLIDLDKSGKANSIERIKKFEK